jgi:hypothetical protein
MKSLRGLAALLVLFASSSCGGKSFDGSEPSTGGTASGGTASGGTAGQGAGGSFSGGSSGGSGGAPLDCTRFDDEAPTAVLVSISNQTFSAIHLGPSSPTCETAPLFSVADATGQALPHLNTCRTSCQVLRAQGAGGCIELCWTSATVTLEPGEVLYTTWDGHYRADNLMPSRCAPASGQPLDAELMCDQAKTIRAGGYTFRAEAGSTLDCASNGTCPSCTPDPQGGCKTTGALVGGKLKVAVATADLNPTYGARELPEPSPPGPGAPADLPQGAQVSLVFTE